MYITLFIIFRRQNDKNRKSKPRSKYKYSGLDSGSQETGADDIAEPVKRRKKKNILKKNVCTCQSRKDPSDTGSLPHDLSHLRQVQRSLEDLCQGLGKSAASSVSNESHGSGRAKSTASSVCNDSQGSDSALGGSEVAVGFNIRDAVHPSGAGVGAGKAQLNCDSVGKQHSAGTVHLPETDPANSNGPGLAKAMGTVTMVSYQPHDSEEDIGGNASESLDMLAAPILDISGEIIVPECDVAGALDEGDQDDISATAVEEKWSSQTLTSDNVARLNTTGTLENQLPVRIQKPPEIMVPGDTQLEDSGKRCAHCKGRIMVPKTPSECLMAEGVSRRSSRLRIEVMAAKESTGISSCESELETRPTTPRICKVGCKHSHEWHFEFILYILQA